MKSLAAILENINQPLKILEIDIPPLNYGQVLVKIAYTGLCYAQLHEFKGKKGENKFLPHTLGHEGSGVVIEIGDGVTKVKPGEHVVASWIKGKGLNAPTTQYFYGERIINSGAISTFMTHAVISEDRLIPIQKNIPLKLAALLGSTIPTGMEMLINTLKLKPGSSIAVFGLGGIGLSALIAAKILYADKIIAVDITEGKLKLAETLGATHTINALNENVPEKIAAFTNGQGVDYSIETSGNKDAMEQAFKSVKNGKGLCLIAGNLKHDEIIEINPFDLILGKKIIGNSIEESQIEEDILLYSKEIEKGNFDSNPLINYEFKLSQINEAIELLDNKKTNRCLINIES